MSHSIHVFTKTGEEYIKCVYDLNNVRSKFGRHSRYRKITPYFPSPTVAVPRLTDRSQ